MVKRLDLTYIVKHIFCNRITFSQIGAKDEQEAREKILLRYPQTNIVSSKLYGAN